MLANNYIKCYKMVYFVPKKKFNEEQDPCNTCLHMLECMSLDKFLHDVFRFAKHAKVGQTYKKDFEFLGKRVKTFVIEKIEE